MDFKAQNRKKVIIGFIIGIVAPILASPIVNAILFMQHPMTHNKKGMVTSTTDFWAFYVHNVTHPYKLPIFLSFCVLADALVVFFMVQKVSKKGGIIKSVVIIEILTNQYILAL
mgnify:CR=1 FL=1